MTKNLIKATALLAILSLSSCNYFTRAFGGKMTVELEPGQHLVNASWKDTDLWLLVRARKTGESPETYKYVERSTLGALQGEVTIIEK